MGLYVIIGAGIIVVALVLSIAALRWGTTNTPDAPNSPGVPNRNKLTAQLRTVTGLLAVIAGDTAIAGAAIWGVHKTEGDSQWAVAILTSAFTSIVAITTAYFGIRAVTNMAEKVSQDVADRDARPRP